MKFERVILNNLQNPLDNTVAVLALPVMNPNIPKKSPFYCILI